MMGIRKNVIRHEGLMVSYTVVNGWTVVEVDGGVDSHTAPMLPDAVFGLLDEGHVHFVLELGFVTFMDSTGLGAIIAMTKRIRGRGGSLCIASATGRVSRVFEIAALRDTYEFYPSVDDATRSSPALGSSAESRHTG